MRGKLALLRWQLALQSAWESFGHQVASIIAVGEEQGGQYDEEEKDSKYSRVQDASR